MIPSNFIYILLYMMSNFSELGNFYTPWRRDDNEVCVDGSIEGVRVRGFQLEMILSEPLHERRTFYPAYRRQCQRTLRRLWCNPYAKFLVFIFLSYSLIHSSNFGIFSKFKFKSNIRIFSPCCVVDDLDAVRIGDTDSIIIISFPPINLIVANVSGNSSDFESHRSKQQDV